MNEPFILEDTTKFGALLRLRRKELGLTMIDVSKAVGIGRNHYGRIEAGVLSPRTAFVTIFKILMVLKYYWTIEVRAIPDDTNVPIHIQI